MSRIVLVAALLAGCASGTAEWFHPRFTEERFAQDRWACMSAAQVREGGIAIVSKGLVNWMDGGTSTHPGLFRACMEARGWTVVTR